MRQQNLFRLHSCTNKLCIPTCVETNCQSLKILIPRIIYFIFPLISTGCMDTLYPHGIVWVAKKTPTKEIQSIKFPSEKLTCVSHFFIFFFVDFKLFEVDQRLKEPLCSVYSPFGSKATSCKQVETFYPFLLLHLHCSLDVPQSLG